MMNEQKMERLLRMAEHPELYDDRELEELMCDEECREAYELMVELGASRGPSKEKEMQSSSQSLQGEELLAVNGLTKARFYKSGRMLGQKDLQVNGR